MLRVCLCFLFSPSIPISCILKIPFCVRPYLPFLLVGSEVFDISDDIVFGNYLALWIS